MTRERELSVRIALAWREMRRGASATALRASLLGPDAPPLEQAQLDALEILAAPGEEWRMTDFADALRVDPSNATRAVDRLERLGLAERTRATDDKRVVLVGVTARGRALVRNVNRLRADGMRRLLEPFDPDEQEQFAEYLDRFVASMDRIADELRRD